MRAQDDERIGGKPAPRRGLARPALFGLVALAAIAVLGLAVRELLRAPPPLAVQTPTSAQAPPAATPGTVQPAPRIQPETPIHGDDAVAVAQGLEPPLPSLAQSDPEVRTTLAQIIPGAAHSSLAPGDLLHRAATLIDGFSRGKLLRDKLPLPAVPGKLIVVEHDGRLLLDPANHARYDALVEALSQLDTAALGRWFNRYEPLLQQAYEELGNGDARVRQALLGGLDLMLAAPEAGPAIELTQPAVFFKYADPALEALPDAQKLLLRMGPRNRARVLERVARLRAALAGPVVGANPAG